MLNGAKESHKIGIRDRVWEKIIGFYKGFLRVALRFRWVVLILFVSLSLFFSFLLVKQSKFVLFPEFDTMSINITGKVKGNAFALTSQESKNLENALIEVLKPHNVSSVHSTIGMKSDGRSQHEMGNSLFTITINLKPKITDD